MCLGIPGRVIERSADEPDLAQVDVEGVARAINVALLEDDPPQPGDWVLIHLGFALQKMTDAEVADAHAAMAIEAGGEAAEAALASFSVVPGARS